MIRKRIIVFIPLAAALILEILPFGAALVFMPSPDPESRFRELYSYFDLLPLGYGNIGPMLTGVLTCAALLLLLIPLKASALRKAAQGICAAAALCSLLPLLYGLEFYTAAAGFISLLLICECIVLRLVK